MFKIPIELKRKLPEGYRTDRIKEKSSHERSNIISAEN
jgi:hypothetical protein